MWISVRPARHTMETRGTGVVRGLSLILLSGIFVFLILIRTLELRRLELVFQSLANIAVLGLIVVFQPEIRRAIVQLGESGAKYVKGGGSKTDTTAQSLMAASGDATTSNYLCWVTVYNSSATNTAVEIRDGTTTVVAVIPAPAYGGATFVPTYPIKMTANTATNAYAQTGVTTLHMYGPESVVQFLVALPEVDEPPASRCAARPSRSSSRCIPRGQTIWASRTTA